MADYQHIFISPHFDDIALSCGGLAARLAKSGARVLVVTVCTREPEAGTQASALVREVHGGFRLGDDEVINTRREEDAAAMQLLGADRAELGFMDAIYRHPDTYSDLKALFGSVRENDALLADLADALHPLIGRNPSATWYAPLGIGMHVDHQIVHTVASRLAAEGVPLVFYEDYPYAQWPGELDRRLQSLGGKGAFETRTIPIDDVWWTKLRAIVAYRSQLKPLFGGHYQFRTLWKMYLAVRRHAVEQRPPGASYGERLWFLAPAPPPDAAPRVAETQSSTLRGA